MLIVTVYLKGGEDALVPIEELKDYLNNNADKVETRHREVRRIRLIGSSTTIGAKRGKL